MPSACIVMPRSPLGKEARGLRGCHEGRLTRETGKQRNSYKVRVGAFSAISVLFESRWVMWSCCLSALLSLRHHFLLSFRLFPPSFFFFLFGGKKSKKKIKKRFSPPNNLHKCNKHIDVLQSKRPDYRAQHYPIWLFFFLPPHLLPLSSW